MNDITLTSKERGIYHKFNVVRTDGKSAPGQKHHGCFYFVLDCDHDPHARAALLAYAASCEADYPALASDVRAIVESGAAFGSGEDKHVSDAVTIQPAHEPRADLVEIAAILDRYAGWFNMHDHEPRGREMTRLAEQLRAAQPPGACRHGTREPHECRECIDEDVIRSRAFWSDGRRDLITAYVSEKDITLMNDNGHVLEPADNEQRHGPSPTKEGG